MARKAKLYYVNIDDWDFSRDEHMKSIVRAETEGQTDARKRDYEEEEKDMYTFRQQRSQE